MKRAKRIMSLIWLCMTLTFLFLMPARAKTIELKDTALKNVMEAPAVEGSWVKEAGKYRFQPKEGKLLKNQWIKTRTGRVYYLNESGYRLKGWAKYRGNLYYMTNKGVYLGWFKGAKRYYFRPDGTMADGYQVIDKAGYYFTAKSGAAKGWTHIGKYDYYFSVKNYKMLKSMWIKTDKKYYYVNKKGRKCKQGWLTLDDKKYYLDENGARVTGTQFIDGKGYYFNKQGVYDPTVVVKDEVDPKKPMVALTFDDGPGPYTNRLLDCLERNHAKATFFMVGQSVSGYSSVVKRMALMKCELGNHSYTHANMASISADSRVSQVSRTNSAIRSAAGEGPTVFRLPYGSGHNSSSVLSSLGLPSIYWSIDTRDWENTGNAQHTIDAVLNSVRSGDIVLMHDIHQNTVRAAETIIPALINRGYQLVTVSQLAKYKGKTNLQAGKTYYSFK